MEAEAEVEVEAEVEAEAEVGAEAGAQEEAERLMEAEARSLRVRGDGSATTVGEAVGEAGARPHTGDEPVTNCGVMAAKMERAEGAREAAARTETKKNRKND